MAKASKKSTAGASKKQSKTASKKAAPAKKTSSKSASKSSSKSASKSSSKGASKSASKSASKGSSKSAAKKSARKPNAAFMAPQTPSGALADVIGSKPVPRTEIVKKIWDYIKKNDLQDKKNRRMINADEKLKPLFGKDQFSMFEVASVVNKNIK